MTTFDSTIVVIVVLSVVAVCCGWVMARSLPQPASRTLPPPISGGAIGAELVEVYTRLDDVMTTLQDIHADILRRPPGAAPLATAAPKDHRPQFVLTSQERNNKVLRKIYTCRVEGCPDTLIDEEPEPVLQEAQS